MTNYIWQGGPLDSTDSWGQPNPDNPVVPDSDDNVNITGAGALTGSLSVIQVLMSGAAGGLNLSGSITTSGIFGFQAGGLTISAGAVLTVAQFNFGRGDILQNGGAVTAVGAEYLVGNIGLASYSQSGGTHTVNGGLFVGTSGTGLYTLTGGDLITNAVKVGETGTGTFDQQGGTHTVAGLLELGADLNPGFNPPSTGSYALSGGALSVQTLSVGADKFGTGVFMFNAAPGDDATLTISGTGGLPGLIVGHEGSGSFTMGGGTLKTKLAVAMENDGLGHRSEGTFTLQGGKLISTEEIIGVEGDGFFIQTAGSNRVTGTGLVVGSIGAGTYTLQDGTLDAASEIIGDRGMGTLEQTGGVHQVKGALILGNTGSGQGHYQIAGDGKLNVNGNMTLGVVRFGIGTLDISGADAVVTVAEGRQLTLGKGGYGEVTQSAGQLTAKVVIGADAFAPGLYDLSGGTLTSKSETVGAHGSGAFTQSGGSNLLTAPGARLVLAANGDGSGTYELSGGILRARSETVGERGTGTFTQSGGTNTVTRSDLIVGNRSGSSGTYELHSGALTVAKGDLVIGARGGSTGAFEMNTGPGDAGTLDLVNGGLVVGDGGTGSFTLGGGVLSAALVLGAQSGSDGTFDLQGGELISTGGNQLIGAQGSGEFIHKAGSNTIENGGLFIGSAGGEGTYTLGGTGELHIAGGFLKIAGSGTSHGTFLFNTEAGDEAKLAVDTKVITVGVHGTADFIMGGGKLNAKMVVGGQTGAHGKFELDAGTVRAAGQVVGNNGTGTINMNGGIDRITQGGSLIMGAFSLGKGTFNLAGGKLSNGGELVGYAGVGTFTQTGGSNTIAGRESLLDIGVLVGAQGLYTLTAGSLEAVKEVVGDEGLGAFVQNGGRNTIEGPADGPAGRLVIGAAETGTGSYELNDGKLKTEAEFVGDAGEGAFTQKDGEQGIAGLLNIGAKATGTGDFVLEDGELTAEREVVGDAGTGTFTQSGGTNIVTGALELGLKAGGDGTYTLEKGKLDTLGEIVGSKGDGAVLQSGGTNTVTGDLIIGKSAGSTGLYQMTGGRLEVVNPEGLTATLVVGGVGAGVMTVADARVVTANLRIGGSLTAEAGGAITVENLLDMRGGLLDVELGRVVVGNGTAAAGSVLVGATGVLTGAGIIDADLREALNGSVTASGGVLTITGDVSGTGTLRIEEDAVLELMGGSGNGVAFLGDGGVLRLHEAEEFGGRLSELSAGDTIELLDIAATQLKLKGGRLTVTESDGSKLVFQVAGDLTGNRFVLTDDGAGGSIITLTANGFVPLSDFL